MGAHVRRRAAAALPVVAVVTTMVLAAPARADIVLQAQTAATAVHVSLTQQPASSLITASAVDDAAAYAAGAFDSTGGSDAQAATFYPGNLVAQGPALFCSQLFPCPTAPPDYPLLADASYPRRTHAQAQPGTAGVGSGPFAVAPSVAVASADNGGNTGHTTAGATTLFAGTPAAVHVGGGSSTSSISTKGGALLVHVESVATDIDVAGIVHIGSVRAVDDVTVHDGQTPVDEPHVTIAGVTVAGTPATIDETGIHVAGQTAPNPVPRLAQQGVSIAAVYTEHHDSRALVRSQATGLAIDFAVPVSGVPYVPNPASSYPPFDNVPGVDANGSYVGRLTLGAVGVVAGANAQPVFGVGGLQPLGTPGAAGATSASAAGTGAVSPPAGGRQTAAAPAGAAPVVAGRSGLLRGVLDGFTTDLAGLYAAIALGSLTLFVAWRGTVVARRRGSARRAS
jgi:hypothetical protein